MPFLRSTSTLVIMIIISDLFKIFCVDFSTVKLLVDTRGCFPGLTDICGCQVQVGKHA